MIVTFWQFPLTVYKHSPSASPVGGATNTIKMHNSMIKECSKIQFYFSVKGK